ncbi:nitrate reductase NapA [Jhaorihella thermophila]|uniref:Nitrate reductase NapA n=1 Tax=Jhaorihella thermophila TaxID=488547 RepID=A0A1H5VFH8_9RHOB|nr:nitrate reductase NapA [Jhaorihella thermophila]
MTLSTSRRSFLKATAAAATASAAGITLPNGANAQLSAPDIR